MGDTGKGLVLTAGPRSEEPQVGQTVVNGLKSRVHPSGRTGVEQQEVSRGLVSFSA